MSKKKDVRQIASIADDFGMTPDEKREFGDYVEACKKAGDMGSGPNGDFTYAELQDKVSELRGGNS